MPTSPKLSLRGFNASMLTMLMALSPLALRLPGWLLALLAALTALAWLQRQRGKDFSTWIRIPVTIAATLMVIGAYGNFGRDTGAALLATMLVLKLLETRRIRDARLVVSFSLFGTVAAFLFDQGPMVVGLSLLAMLMALASLAYLTDEAMPGNAEAEPLGLAIAGRLRNSGRLLALSIPLALAGFFLFPRLANPLWGLPSADIQARTGVSETMSPGDMMELFADDSPILRVSFPGVQPDASSLYWRGPVLWNFDGRTWERGTWLDSSKPGELIVEGPQLEYEATQEPTERRYVFALDMPQVVPDKLFINPDRTVLSQQPLSSISKHRMVSAPTYRLEPSLPSVLRERALRLPDGFNPRALALAQQWKAEDPRPEALVRKAFDLFNREFIYSLQPPLLGRDSVDDFLFSTRTGYCEHFSSAFSVLMRAAGVPTRVVLGYHGGWYSATGNYWLVANSDAHAWTEVWVEGRGWLRVDPTSAVAPERIMAGGGSGLMERGALSEYLLGLAQRADWIRRGWNEMVLGFNAQRQQDLLAPFGIDTRDWRMIGATFAVAALLAVLATLWLVLRQGLAAVPPLPRAWRRLRRRALRQGLVTTPSEGPKSFTERAMQRFPASSSQLQALSRRYIAWRYAGDELSARQQAELVRELNRLRLRARPTRPQGDAS